MKRTPEEIPALTSALTVHHSAMQRNKRCLLAYLQARVLQIEQVRWDFGQAPPASVRDSYSPFEQQYMSQYNQILQTYMGSVQCTLTEDLNPPKDLLAEVRCLTNEGEIVTENGTIVLRKNSTLFLRRSDVDMLIRQGLVEHVHSTDR
ncbi:Psf1, variant [Capsaspora owczarzaki ATCC 30864]|nr:Psf1, variant [Capsaspora owczarzaki ATCC 30864]